MEKQLDLERIRFLRLLFDAVLRYRELSHAYHVENRDPDPYHLETLITEVFRPLRQTAHAIFRQDNEFPEQVEGESLELLCDLIIGACYHEICQLEEGLILTQLYRPRYENLQAQAAADRLQEFFEFGRDLISETEQQIPRSMEWVGKLLEEALSLVRSLLPRAADNRIIRRFLLRNYGLVESVYGPQATVEMFDEMYPTGGLGIALWECALDLADSGHFHSCLDRLNHLVVVAKQSGPDNASCFGERVGDLLGRVEKWGRAARDNDLINRSLNLQQQFDQAFAQTRG